MSDHWTNEQGREYFRTGKEPGVEPKQATRQEVRVDGGRHHRVLVRRHDLGLTFSSLTEERRYDWLVAQPEVTHVDVHPRLQLPHGIRYEADFLVHFVPLGGGFMAKPRLEDVKSKRSINTAFRRLKRIVDSSHPYGPLWVVQYIDKSWKMTK